MTKILPQKNINLPQGNRQFPEPIVPALPDSLYNTLIEEAMIEAPDCIEEDVETLLNNLCEYYK